MDVTFFRTHPLTKGLSHKEIERLEGFLVERTFAEGDTLLGEGTAIDGLFIVAEGDIRVVKRDPSGADREVAVLSAPTVIGELELIGGQPALASARATSPVKAMELGAPAFDKLVNDGDAIASKITRNIARVAIQRLEESNTKMVALFALMNT